MPSKRNQPRPGPDKRAPASASAKLLAAASLLGVSLGVSAAAIPDGAGPAAGAKSVTAGHKLAQKKSAEPPLAPNTLQKSKPVESKQIKWRKPQSNQIKWRKPQSNQIKWRKP